MKRKLILATVAMVAASPASAQIRLAAHVWNPKATPADRLVTVVERPESVDTLLRKAWDSARAPGCDEIKAQVVAQIRAQVKKSEVPLTEFYCDLGPASSTQVKQSGQQLILQAHMPTNKVRFKLVLQGFGRPDFFLEMPFALDVTVTAVSGQPGYLLKVADVKPVLRVGDVKVDGASFAGDAVVKFGEIANINFSKLIRDRVQQQAIPVGNVIDRINETLGATGAAQSYVTTKLWYRGGRLIIVGEPRFSVQKANVAGNITAQPTDPQDCSGIPVTVTSYGPGRITDPFAAKPAFATGETYSSEATSTGKRMLPGGGVSCPFQLSNVAVGANSIAEVPNLGRQTLGKVAKVGPLSQPIAIPTSGVTFKMSWGLGGSGAVLESQFKPQKAQVAPGVAVSNPGTAVSQPANGGRQMQPGSATQKTVGKMPVITRKGKAPVVKSGAQRPK